jgi:tetratricopeptide (TPR) repeat protein
MLIDLRDKLKPIGRLSILDDVVKKAKQYLDHLPKDAITDLRLGEQSVSLDNLGDVLNAQGKLQEAMDAYRQSLAIRQKLAEHDRSNPGWQRDLLVSYNAVGDVLAAQGNLQEALDAYRRGLDIVKRVAEQDKANAEWQRLLAIAWQHVGGGRQALGDLPGAAEAYQRDFEISQRFLDEDPTDPGLLAVILDLFSRRVVGWKLGENLEAELVVTALPNALVLRQPDEGLYFHSDRGSQ